MEKLKNNLLHPSTLLIAAVLFLVFLFISLQIPNYLVIHAENPNQLVVIKDDMTSVTLLAVGDIMLGRNVENLMNKNGDDYPFVYVEQLLLDADITLANLEGPVVENHKQTPSLSTHFEFDTRVPLVLAANHIDIVSLANNHTFDLGANGYLQTTEYIKKAGLSYFGHPFAFSDAYVIRKTVKNQKFIFVGFNITNPNFNFTKAQEFVSGIQRSHGDFLIAVIHGGDEYKLTSNNMQKNFYRKLIDVGVNSVIAHHPHVVQEIEVYNGKAIFYSLGNFIFDQYFSQDVQDELAVKMTLTKDTVQYDLIPLKSRQSQPRLMTDIEKEVWLHRLAERSPGNIQVGIKKGTLILTR